MWTSIQAFGLSGLFQIAVLACVFYYIFLFFRGTRGAQVLVGLALLLVMLIGVTLSESFLMIPIKSVSGILFPKEIRFESCQLCPREKCAGRRAPYEESLWQEYSNRG